MEPPQGMMQFCSDAAEPRPLRSLEKDPALKGWQLSIGPASEKITRISSIQPVGMPARHLKNGELKHYWIVRYGPIEIAPGQSKEVSFEITSGQYERYSIITAENAERHISLSKVPTKYAVTDGDHVANPLTLRFTPNRKIRRKVYLLQEAVELYEDGTMSDRWFISGLSQALFTEK